MSENITVSVPRGMKEFIEKQKISPSKSFQKMIKELIAKGTIEYFDELEEQKQKASEWEHLYLLQVSAVRDRDNELKTLKEKAPAPQKENEGVKK